MSLPLYYIDTGGADVERSDPTLVTGSSHVNCGLVSPKGFGSRYIGKLEAYSKFLILASDY